MLPENSLKWGRSDNIIRELSAYGAARKAEIGAENVFDFSIGNPSVPAPDCVKQAILEAMEPDTAELHAYTPAPGLMSLRRAIADDLCERGADVSPELVYVTCGASAGLAVSMRALLLPGEQVITFAPFFPEYSVFAEAAGGQLIALPPDEKLQPDVRALKAALNPLTKAILINSPNNPSGVIISPDKLRELCDILRAAEAEFGHTIYLVSDEPYRELVYDGEEVPCPLCYYDNSILCYSFSKSLSLPGERIGYLAVNGGMADKADVFAALCGAARSCGYINAPSLIQRVVEKCLTATADISVYKENRRLLYEGLCACGFDCVYPDGAFYLFLKCPEPDARAFSQRAKKHELLLVPSDDFGLPGYVRVAYCVSPEMIKRALPAFKKLAEEYGL